MFLNHDEEDGLDMEWVELICQAKSIGLTIEDIRKYILEILD